MGQEKKLVVDEKAVFPIDEALKLQLQSYKVRTQGRKEEGRKSYYHTNSNCFPLDYYFLSHYSLYRVTSLTLLATNSCFVHQQHHTHTGTLQPHIIHENRACKLTPHIQAHTHTLT